MSLQYIDFEFELAEIIELPMSNHRPTSKKLQTCNLGRYVRSEEIAN